MYVCVSCSHLLTHTMYHFLLSKTPKYRFSPRTSFDMNILKSVEIAFTNNQKIFFTGDTITGTVEVNLPPEISLSEVDISYSCLGEVKWVEAPESPHYQNARVYFNKEVYHREDLKFDKSDVKIVPNIDFNKLYIPFWFNIPKSIPATVIGDHGYVQHNICVHVDDTTNLTKEIIVGSPMESNLMVTVSAGAKKTVLLTGGRVMMHASLFRKGYSPGEILTVHVLVDNKTNSSVMPRVILRQVQIYMHHSHHKTIENIITEEPIVGDEIMPHSKAQHLIKLPIPLDLTLSIKSSIIAVKYFVHVTLDIPLAFDLHLDLPIILTTMKLIHEQMSRLKTFVVRAEQ